MAHNDTVQFSTPSNQGTVTAKVTALEEETVIGGLREVHKSMDKLPDSYCTFGRHLHDGVRSLLDANPDWIPRCLELIGNPDADIDTVKDAVESVRAFISSACGCTNDAPITGADCATSIRAHLLEAWRSKAGDPDDQVHDWLVGGAPAGIRAHP